MTILARTSGCCNQKLRDCVWEVLPHAPYCPHVSPPYFDLFPKLKEPMRGRSFFSLEELYIYGTRAIRHMKNSGVLDGAKLLPKR